MPRLCIQQLVLECLPVWIRARVLDDNLFVIIGQLVDDVFDRFAELELIELGDALGRDGDSGDSSNVSERTWDIVAWGLCIVRRIKSPVRGNGEVYPELLYETVSTCSCVAGGVCMD